MDNTLFYYFKRVQELYKNTRVKFIYLLLYSPNYNPIEEFFLKIKSIYLEVLEAVFKLLKLEHKAFKKYLKFYI